MDPTYKGLRPPTPSKVKTHRSLNPIFGRILLFGGVFLVLVLAAAMIASFLTPNTGDSLQRLGYRFDALTTLVQDSRGKIKDPALSKINADLASVIGGDNAAFQKGIGTVQITPELAAMKTAETDSETTEKLKTATVNGSFDIVYRSVLTQKIEATVSLMNEVSKNSSSPTLKQTLATMFTHLSTYYQQLKALP